jgi:hypothetical protein
MTISTDLSSAMLRRAVQLKEQIENLEKELDQILSQSGRPQQQRSVAMARSRPGISPAGRARIVAAQKRRWAIHRAQAKSTRTNSSARTSTKAPKGGIPPELRAKLAAQAKARWAKVKALG